MSQENPPRLDLASFRKIRSEFGLGAREAAQQVQYRRYSGTIAEMLLDEKCPVGDDLREAFQEEGINGVVDYFGDLHKRNKQFEFNISQKTLDRFQKKNNDGE